MPVTRIVDGEETIRTLAQAELSAFGPRLRPAEDTWYRGILEMLPVAVYTTDCDGRLTFYNDAAAEFWGHRPKLLESYWCGSWRLWTPDGAELPLDECPMAIALKERRPVRGAEAVAERPDGTLVPFAPYPTPVYDADGVMLGAVNMLVDLSSHKAAAGRQRGLLDELNHRVKNTLSTVQSIAAQTFRDAADKSARELFERRVLALSRAHDVLAGSCWEGASLQELVEEAVLAPLGQARSQVGVQGHEVHLAPKAALSLAMALHELCANARQFGALSVPEGRVDLGWELAEGPDGRRLRLAWTECGGPAVQAPQTSGFGSRLIERGLAHDLMARITLEFAPAGLRCEIDAPLPGSAGPVGGRTS